MIYKMSSLLPTLEAEIYLIGKIPNVSQTGAFSTLTSVKKVLPVHSAKQVIIIVMIGCHHLIALRNRDCGLADVGKVVPKVTVENEITE